MTYLNRARPGWPEYAMAIAHAAAIRSEDPHVQVGACILSQSGTVLATGYNGLPSGVATDLSDRSGIRRDLMIHAETNALRYTTPTFARGGLLASTRHPCLACLTQIAAYGIRQVIWDEEATPAVVDQERVSHVARILGVELVQFNGLHQPGEHTPPSGIGEVLDTEDFINALREHFKVRKSTATVMLTCPTHGRTLHYMRGHTCIPCERWRGRRG